MMRHDAREQLAAARVLVRDLRTLGAAGAPSDVVAGALARVGLADAYWVLDSPLGPVAVAYSELGINTVTRTVDEADCAAIYRARFGRRLVRLARPPEVLARGVEALLRGEQAPQPRFDLSGLTEFEQAVLVKALEIPHGEVRPYAWVAREIGHPKAVRAVGNALAENPVPLLIPCHRVVKSDGRLGRYSMGGDDNKRTVLRAEGIEPEDLEAFARAGIRYLGSSETHVYCFLTCGHALSEPDEHRIFFASDAQAQAAGYHPCKVCRPGSLDVWNAS
jgi:O-6-methylguanine DNA methyltransferase